MTAIAISITMAYKMYKLRAAPVPITETERWALLIIKAAILWLE